METGGCVIETNENVAGKVPAGHYNVDMSRLLVVVCSSSWPRSKTSMRIYLGDKQSG